MKNNFDAVQVAAQARNVTTMNSQTLAQQIVAAAQGDARLAYDFPHTLNAPVTRTLQATKSWATPYRRGSSSPKETASKRIQC